MTISTVSYTHLDVYKRQIQHIISDKFTKQIPPETSHAPKPTYNINTALVQLKMIVLHTLQPVSYTHLDVYKRQFTNSDIVNKLRKFSHMCGAIRRTLKSAREETHLKLYKKMSPNF